VQRTRPVAKELIDELQSLSPKPEQIMGADDRRAIDRLRRRRPRPRTAPAACPTAQGAGRRAARRHRPRARQEARRRDRPDDHRRRAHAGQGPVRCARRDPRRADALAKARDRARSAARQAQEGAIGDEPIRIPGADEYRAPERFREDLLEAMKKKGALAPRATTT